MRRATCKAQVWGEVRREECPAQDENVTIFSTTRAAELFGKTRKRHNAAKKKRYKVFMSAKYARMVDVEYE